MADHEAQNPAESGPTQATGDDRNRRRAPRRESGGKPRSRSASLGGWNDGVARVLCEAMPVQRAQRWPVQHRTGLAESLPLPVDTRGNEVLLCTGEHEGPHLWPCLDPEGELMNWAGEPR